MGRPSKFSLEQMSIMMELLRQETLMINEQDCRMAISDSDMCAIICSNGIQVNTKYIERLRTAMGINSRDKDKFFHDDLAKIHQTMKDYTIADDNGCWRMQISDAQFVQVLEEKGYKANKGYVERMRRSLGIKAHQERTAQGEQRRRLSRVKNATDAGSIQLALLHEQAVYLLSIRQATSSNTYGASGSDVYTPGIGAHTVSYDEAIELKDRRLSRLQNREEKRIAICQAERRQVQMIMFEIGPVINEIKKGNRKVTEEVKAFISDTVAGNGCYTRGRGGAKRSAHDAQVYQSIQ